jgi:hypothetical protein
VQAVLLALHDQGIEYDLLLRPPYKVFKKWGVYMPAISIDDGPWIIESTEILVKLGYKPILVEEINATNSAWQGVLHRTDKPFNFFLAFARGGQISDSFLRDMVNNFLLSFVAFYMFTLINIGKRRLDQQEPENFGDQFLYWEGVLHSSEGPFMDGEKPGTRDFIMFGIAQCHASIPVPTLDAILSDDRLSKFREWILIMQNRFDSYPYLYSAKYFESEVRLPDNTGLIQRIVFFLGLIVMILSIPLTLPLVFFLMARVQESRIKNF